jgi:hypothetical protein
MKNSAWYHKLWRKKLDEYPLKESSDNAWGEMQALLDRHMPLNNKAGNGKSGKTLGSLIVSALGYILPAAAMIGGLTFVAVKQAKHPFAKKPLSKISIPVSKSLFQKKNEAGSLSTDSINYQSRKSEGGLPNIEDSTKTTHPGEATIGKAGFLKQAHGKASQPVINGKQSIDHNGRFKKGNGYFKNSGQPMPDDPYKDNLYVLADSSKELIAVNEKWSTGFINRIGNPLNGITVNNFKGPNFSLLREEKPTGLKSAKAKNQSSAAKSKVPKAPKQFNIDEPQFNFSLQAVLNTNNTGSNPGFGLWGNFLIKPKWLLNTGLHLDLTAPLSGSFVHPSYQSGLGAGNQPDSSFKITDSRKLTVISIPVNLEYKISNIISVNAGSLLSFSVKQTQPITKLSTITNLKDTLGHTQTIDSALKINSINKINLGFSGGISIKLHQFYIDGTYQQNITPYTINTGLGGYKQYYRTFQIGIRYKFKKKGG